MVLVVFSVVDQLFEVGDVLVDVWPAHLQASQFVTSSEGFPRVQELGTKLRYELVVGISVIWLSEHPVAHEAPP